MWESSARWPRIVSVCHPMQQILDQPLRGVPVAQPMLPGLFRSRRSELAEQLVRRIVLGAGRVELDARTAVIHLGPLGRLADL